MVSGVPIDRQLIFVLQDGTAVLDWGNDLVQDLLSGDFIHTMKGDYSYPIRDDELEILRRAGRVESYDSRQVRIFSLPERPQQTLD
jgi:hypothetical protein